MVLLIRRRGHDPSWLVCLHAQQAQSTAEAVLLQLTMVDWMGAWGFTDVCRRPSVGLISKAQQQSVILLLDPAGSDFWLSTLFLSFLKHTCWLMMQGGGYLACQTQFLASRTSSTSETASLETPEEDPTALDEAAAPAEACSPQVATICRHICYSPSYRVPVLFFAAHWSGDGLCARCNSLAGMSGNHELKW